jgi:signal peptidase II
MMKLEKEKLLPMSLAAIIITVDQIIKAVIVKLKPEFGLIKDVFNNDFLWIYHVRNKAIAFSLGEQFPDPVKRVLFVVLPILVLGFLLFYYFRSNEFTKLQRWAAAGIIGGGIGNIIDRVFRTDGVVDFISVRFYGLFGFERWPTFNIADSSVVICCILLFVSVFVSSVKKEEKKEAPAAEEEKNEEPVNE